MERRTVERRLTEVGVPVRQGKSYLIKDLFRALNSENSKARTRISVAAAEKLERQNQENQRQLIKLENARGIIEDIANSLLGETERVFCAELPPVLVGKTVIEIQKRIIAAHDKMSAGVREKFLEWSKKP